MKKILRCLPLLLFMITGLNFTSNAQELECKVDVLTREVETSNQQLFETLEKSVHEFMNNTNWTQKDFKPHEKIQCNLVINIKERSNHNYTASARIKSSRPVYGSSYNTSILNYFDQQFNFTYRENEDINYIEGSFTSNLSSLLSFYAYLIIGLDFDTFSETGGTQYFQKAESVVTAAQSSPFKGWKNTDKNNRYLYINQLLGARFEAYRVALYEYHRKGLDVMYEKTDEGRKHILSSLQQLQKVHEREPNSFLVNQFFEAKSEEITSIFSKADPNEKSKVMNILQTLDPSNLSQYEEEIQG